ncbi:MAG: DUF3185 family protein [Pseudomonadota bacterium]
MNKVVGLVLVIVGAILLYMSYQASESLASEASQAVMNEPTDSTMWYLIGGIAAVIIGLYAVLKGKK